MPLPFVQPDETPTALSSGTVSNTVPATGAFADALPGRAALLAALIDELLRGTDDA